MARYKMTDEERAAADDKRARFKGFCQRVAAMTDEERAALAAHMPVVTVEGHPLSHHNTCLLLAQIEAPTIVGGFKQWAAAGRRITSGKGSALLIWIPTKRKAQPAADGTADDDAAVRPGFIAGSVWDISQTAPFGADDLAAAPLEHAALEGASMAVEGASASA